ncbi:thioredoxin reductase (NADPH) [Pseudonocardia ammonioxydans]|uniref:Thioredoxin reductase (NADPH) n=1 Tax=Pseudonocardia ammonioxydans TaxID=260086 RepID=A0A1I4TXU3_PSUAM|nr:NAD(P)/FAD-dependent oxidoreductase [Pseudonocardia ammonioxydans]SFM81616.1 thioredoxin reductase (NADPH) [Pseudonocardia ammonioxydans]
MTDDVWDLAVVGAGMAGLTAATVAAEHGARTVALDRLAPGGQLINLGDVSDYPGLPVKTSGPDLAGTLLENAMSAGVEISYTEVTELTTGSPHTVRTLDGSVAATTVVVATGLAPGRLDVPGADEWAGRGLSECASCDGPLFTGQRVVVVGDDDWAAQEAVELAGVAAHVTVLLPGPSPLWSARRAAILAASGVAVREGAVVVGIDGDRTVTGIRLADGVEIPATGVFAQVGREPRSGLVEGVLKRAADGRITGTPDADAPGLHVAGPVRAGVSDHLIAAAADGLAAGLAAVADLQMR